MTLVRVEAVSCDNSVRLLDTYKLVGIHFLSGLIPVEQFGIKTLSFAVLYIHIPYQLPKPFFVIIIGSICFNTGFYIKDRVELLHIHTFFKRPIRRLFTVVHHPLFRVHPITCHSGIGYKGSNSQCGHHRKRITFCDSLSHSFLFSATGR